MPTYFYKAVSSSGEKLEGEMEAASQSVAIEKLQNSGHIPISAVEASKAKRNTNRAFKLPRFNNGQLNANHITIMTRELATLLHAGLPLDHALQTLESVSSNPDCCIFS